MGREILTRGEIGLVGGNERQVERIGEVYQAGFGLCLDGKAMTLQLDIEPPLEDRGEPGKAAAGERRLALDHGLVHRPGRAAGEADQPRRKFLEQRQRDMRLGGVGAVEPGPAGQPHEVGIALGVLGEERQHRQPPRHRQPRRRTLRLVAEIDPHRGADDRLDPLAGHHLGEFQRPEQIVAVGQRHRRHVVVVSELGELLHRQRPLRQGISRMRAQMDERRWCCGRAVRHGPV